MVTDKNGETTCNSENPTPLIKEEFLTLDEMRYQWHSWFRRGEGCEYENPRDMEAKPSLHLEMNPNRNEIDPVDAHNELDESEYQTWSACLACIKSLQYHIDKRRHGSFNPTVYLSVTKEEFSAAVNENQCDQENIIEKTKDMIRLTKKNDVTKDLIPCIFYWPYEAQNVYIAGTFLTQRPEKKIRMIRSANRFVAVLELPRGIYYYKFLVDGQWRFSPTHPTHQSSDGYTNNVLDLSSHKKQSFNVIFDYEKARTSKYHKTVPNLSSYTSQAPNIPLLLRKSKTILFDGCKQNATVLHSLCNHMYLNMDCSNDLGEGVLCASVTCRSRGLPKTLLSTTGPRFGTLIYVTLKNPNDRLTCIESTPLYGLMRACPS